MKSSMIKLIFLAFVISAISCQNQPANDLPIKDLLASLKNLENAIVNASAPLTVCHSEIFQMIRHPLTKLSQVMNTGKGLNDLGNYEACNSDASSKYMTLTVKPKGSNGFYSAKLGICGPASCSVTEYNSLVESYGQKAAQSLGLLGLGDLEFTFYAPNENKSEELDVSAIAFITVTFILFGIGLAGTSVDLFQSFWREHRQKRIEERNKRIKSKYLSSGQYSTLVLTDDERGASANEQLLEDEGKNVLLNEKKAAERTPKTLEFLACFSYTANLKKIFANLSQAANPRLDILNGIRCLSMVWVLYGHTFYYFLSTPILNPYEPLKLIKSFWWQALLQAPFSVDSFFLLAGFLSAYGFIGELKKRNGKINIPILYIHRYLRIIPLYAFVFFGYWALVRHLNSGPVWPDLQKNLVDYQCPDYWWTNMLFINNIVPWNDPAGCFGWSWYLANDFQFFLVTPFILLAYYKNRKFGWAVIILTLLGSFSATIAISVINQYPVNFTELQPVYLTYYRDLYSKPWTRISPYLIGIIMAYTYMEHKEEGDKASSYIKIVRKGVANKFVRFLMYGLGVSLTTLMVFLPYDANKEPGHWSAAGSAVYYSFGRSLFALGIVLVIYPCLQGHFNLLYKILGATFWTPIARITFAVYLVHPIIMQVIYYGTLQGTYFNSFQMNYFFFANLLISLIAGLLLTLFIESPFMNIHKNFLFKSRQPSPKPKEAPGFKPVSLNAEEGAKDAIKNL